MGSVLIREKKKPHRELFDKLGPRFGAEALSIGHVTFLVWCRGLHGLPKVSRLHGLRGGHPPRRQGCTKNDKVLSRAVRHTQ